jgi:hypothetical protein
VYETDREREIDRKERHFEDVCIKFQVMEVPPPIHTILEFSFQLMCLLLLLLLFFLGITARSGL